MRVQLLKKVKEESMSFNLASIKLVGMVCL